MLAALGGVTSNALVALEPFLAIVRRAIRPLPGYPRGQRFWCRLRIVALIGGLSADPLSREEVTHEPRIRDARSRRRRSGLLPSLAAATTIALSACASTPEEPTAQLRAAEQAIADAERAEAGQHAAGELSEARTKLESANAAVRDEKMEQAARLAEQARVDAELANARTAAAKAQAVNDEMKRSTQTLIEEMQRRPGGTP
jgi:hypothetical protein